MNEDVARALIDEYLPLLSQGDTTALEYFHRDATFHWDGREPVSGKLKIGEEIRLIPLFTHELSTLDCQSSGVVPYHVVVVTGVLQMKCEQQVKKFHSSFYLYYVEGEDEEEASKPLIMYQTMKILDNVNQ